MGWVELRSGGMRALRAVRSRMGGAVIVLTYHRVQDISLDPQRLAVPVARFDEHVAALSSRYELMTAGDLFRRMAEGVKLPRRGLVITLDDGYADSLGAALPVLKAHDACATVFVSSGFVAGNREFWWDELERLVLAAPELPTSLALDVGGKPFRREIAQGTRELSAEVVATFSGWDFTKAANHPRQQLYVDLTAFVEPLSATDREFALAALREQTGVAAIVRPEKRPLSAAELPTLEAGGHVEIGAHTVSHVRLGQRSVAEQREEIVGSKAALEQMCGHDVVSFSYPYGTAGSFTAETERLVREAGFLGAVTTELGAGVPWGTASRGANRYAVPRMATANVPAAELIATIDKRLAL